MPQDPGFHRPQPIPEQPRKPPRLDLYMPATPPLQSLSVLEFWVSVLWRRLRFRRQVHALLGAPDAVIDDVGLDRGDIQWALNLPIRVDALKALARCRRARRVYRRLQGEASCRATLARSKVNGNDGEARSEGSRVESMPQSTAMTGHG